MRISEFIGDAFSAIANKLVRPADFTCGDCERSARCSLPPGDNCIARAEQLERGDWKLKRRARSMLQQGM
jgi:hypothetical protein